jgi:glycosyltransferase involved in cell wall biosynthesis
MQVEHPVEVAAATLGRSRLTQTQRVLHVINGEHYSGAERVQDLLALALPEFGFEVGFACLKPNRFPKARRAQGSPLYEVGMRSRLDWSSGRRLEKIVVQEGYRLLHAHTPRSLMIASRVAKRLHLPLVYHVHSPVGRDSTRGWRNRINQWIETRSLRGVDRMICVSNSIGRYMQSLGHSPQKIAVVPNGVPRSTRVHPPVTQHTTWTIGMVALFRPRKGIEVLLDALALLKRRHVHVNLLAVGPFESPEYDREIKGRVDQLHIGDRVRWAGFCQDVDEKLMEMDVFVLPSLFGEGLPMVVLEAMSVGLPTIASRVEGIPEAIRAGVDGLIFEPGNAEDLASQIESLIVGRFDWMSMSEQARRRQAECFSDQSMAQAVAAVYRQL